MMSNYTSLSCLQTTHFTSSKVKNVETNIFLNRLIGVFEILMNKLEFASTIPLILTHAETLDTIDRRDLKQIVATFSRFFDHERGSNEYEDPENLSIYEDDCDCSYKSGRTVVSVQESAEIYNALQILSSYPNVERFARISRSEMKRTTLNFMRQIKFFMEYVTEKVQLMPEEERAKELYCRNVCSLIDKAKTDISDLMVNLEKQKARHQKETDELAEELEDAMEAWEKINEDFRSRKAKILEDSEENLAKALIASNERMDQLKNAHDSLKAKVMGEKLKHKKLESDIQSKKFKVESQLTGIITKYDIEIAERQEAYDELMVEFNEVDGERLQFMAALEEQMTIYNKIIQEREEKEFEEYREKYETFVWNRCAKIIQRWWKSIYWKIKAKRKKGKKKKKGKAK